MATFVDIGNTNVKILDRTIKTSEFDVNDFLEHDDFVISSVVPKVLEDSINKLKKANKAFMIVNNGSKFSFEHTIYETIGSDLLLAVEGALTMARPPLCVVTAGTAVVAIFVSVKNDKPFYEGGVIIPGFGLQIEMLNQRTAQLPNIQITKPRTFVGNNTNDAMNSGVCIALTNGLEAIIKGAQEQLCVKFNKIVVTGGDGKFLKEISSMELDYVEDLVFRGMKSIYSKKGDTK